MLWDIDEGYVRPTAVQALGLAIFRPLEGRQCPSYGASAARPDLFEQAGSRGTRGVLLCAGLFIGV